MAQVTATAHVFPSANDLFGPGSAGDGRNSYEKNLADRWLAFLFSQNCVISGGLLVTSGTLTMAVPTGKAYLAGRFVEWQATNVTFPASNTSHVWVRVLRDGSTNASSVVIEHNTTGTDPSAADSTKLGTVTTSGSAITGVTDVRSFAFINQARIIKPSVGTPELIDSGVTTAKIADANVTQGKLAKPSVGTPELKTATSSATVTDLTGYPDTTMANITLHDYAFAWSCTMLTGDNIAIRNFNSTADPGNTVGRIRVSTGASGTTTVRWRYVTASDEPTIWLLVDPATGELTGSWVSDDPPAVTEEAFVDDPIDGLMMRTQRRILSDPPIMSVGFQSVPVPLAMLAQVPLSQAALDAADRHIERQKLNPKNLLYRALQFETRTLAPSTWIVENGIYKAGEFRMMTAQERAGKDARRIPQTEL